MWDKEQTRLELERRVSHQREALSGRNASTPFTTIFRGFPAPKVKTEWSDPACLSSEKHWRQLTGFKPLLK